MLLNREKLAEFLGCSLRTVDDYTRQGMPGNAPKRKGDQWRFDSVEVKQWLIDRAVAAAVGDIAKVDETEAKRRKIAAEAALAEFELALKVKAAVSIEDFERAWQAMIGAARSKLLGIGAAVGPEVAILTDAFECSQAIHNAICEALQELSESNIDLLPDPPERPAGDEPEGPEAPDSVGAPSGTNSKRVGRPGKKVKPRVKRKAR